MPQRAALQRIGSRVGQMLLVAFAYFVTAKFSLLVAIPPGYATAIWPPSGIALAGALLLGRHIWPGIWLGAALTNLTVQGSPLLATLIASGNTLEALAAAALVRRYLDSQERLESAEDVVKFVGVCALSPLIAAGIGVVALALANRLPWTDVLANAWTWWQGDASGMIIVTPLVVSWSLGISTTWSRPKQIEVALLAASLCLVSVLAFGGIQGDGTFPLAFITLPFIVWAAISFGQREVTGAITLVCAIAIWYTVKGRGPFGLDSPNASLLFLLAYTSTLAMTGLTLSAVIGQRGRATAQLRKSNDRLEAHIAERTRELEQANQALRFELTTHEQQDEVLRQSEERFRLLVDGVKDYAIFMLEPDGRIASWNTGAQDIYGHAAQEIIGSHLSRFYTPEDLARAWPAHELQVARTEGRFEEEGWRLRKDGTRFWASVVITALRDSAGNSRGFAKVTRDLTVRRKFEALQESERQVNEFLAMLAHELRNPLAPIFNALALMRSKPGQQAELRAMIERQITHLARIVDDLVDVSRITRGKIALKTAVLDLRSIVARALESCQPLIQARGQAVDLRIPDEPLPIEADATRLTQVVLNLINNAAKYTPEGGRILVVAKREDDQAVLQVRDTGIGIEADLLPKIFDVFVQGDRSLARTDSGLGIGLTLVKRIVTMHGGSVTAVSEGPGQGSEFVVRLPLVRDGRGVSESTEMPDSAASARHHRVLIVDDNRDFADTLGALLEAMGHDVRTAYDGRVALALVNEFSPDVALLDIGLPGVDGYQIAQQLRSSPKLSDITLIALTGYSHDQDRRRVREAGFNHHLVKPIETGELIKVLDSLLPSSAARTSG